MKIILKETQLSLIHQNLINEVNEKKPSGYNETLDFQTWVIKTKKDKNILGKGGKTGFGDDGNWGDKTEKAWNKYKNEYKKPNSKNNKFVDPSKGANSLSKVVKDLFVKLTKGKNPASNSSLLFDGNKLMWVSNGSVINSWKATSGVNLLNAEPNQWLTIAKNLFSSKQEKSKLKEFGPTPEGDYYVGKLQTSNLEKTNPFMDFARVLFQKGQSSHDWNKDTAGTRIAWGYYRAPIIPKSGTNTYGRSSFYVHGGALPASHGCIDLTSSMDDFAKFYSSWAAKYKKNSIPLKVKYSSFFENIS